MKIKAFILALIFLVVGVYSLNLHAPQEKTEREFISERLFGAGSPSAPEYIGGADSAGSTNSGEAGTTFSGSATTYFWHGLSISGNYAFVVARASSTACSITASSHSNGCELQIYDISTPSTPTYVGGADASGATNSGTGSSDFHGVFVSGNYAYVTKNGSNTNCNTVGNSIGCELQVYDVSTPSTPTYVGGADSTGGTNTGTGSVDVRSIYVSGNYAYITSGNGGGTCSSSVSSGAQSCEVKIFDISTPSTPTYVAGIDASGSVGSGTGNKVNSGVFVSGSNLFVTGQGSATTCSSSAGSAIGCELQVYDVSTPSTPSYVGGADVGGETNAGTASKDVYSVFISGNNALVSGAGNATTCSATAGSGIGCELQIYDISTPSTPTYLSGIDATASINTGTGNSGFRNAVATSTYAFVSKAGSNTTCSATTGSGIGCETQVYNISNPSSPTYIGGADSSGSANSGTNSVASQWIEISGANLFVARPGITTTCSQTIGSASGCELQIYDISTLPVASSAVFGDIIIFE